MVQNKKVIITKLEQLGFVNADFAAPTTGIVDRTTVALNFQKISNKMASSNKFKDATLNIVLNQSTYGNLFASILNGVFGNRPGIAVRMNVVMDARTDIKQDQIVTFTQDLGGTTADGATNKITLSLAGIDTTTPKLVQTDNFVSQHIATLMYTTEMDAANAGKTFEQIFEELHNKRNQVSKAGVFVLPTTGASFSNMWRVVKEKLGIIVGNNSTQTVEFMWSRAESTEYPTTVNVYERDTNRRRTITLLQTPTGFSAEEYKPTLDGQKRYNFVVPAGNWRNNTDIILGQITAGTSGITAPGTLDANIRSLSFVGVADVQQGGVFNALGNPNTDGLFKTNNTVNKNFDITLRFNVSTGSYQDMSVILQKFDGTNWVPLETRKIWRSNDGIVENASSFTTFSTGATDQFNTNSFRIVLRNASGGDIAIPAHTMQLTFRGA